jgi:hypothetical protein
MKCAEEEMRECLLDKDVARVVATIHSMKQIC